MKKFMIFCLSLLITSLCAEHKHLDGFNVVVKDLVIAGKTVRISPFKGIGVVTVNLCFRNAGEKMSPKTKECLVALLSRAMGESTKSKTREQIHAYSREHNVHVEFSANDDEFTITGRCPADNLAQLFKLLKDILFNSSFHDQDLNRFKSEMASSMMQSMQSPDVQLDQLIKCTVFKDHPYGILNNTYIASFKNIAPADLNLHMKKHFTQDNLLISACGDIDEGELASQISALVKLLPKSFNFSLPCDTKVTGPYQENHQSFPVPQTKMEFLHEGIGANHPDFFALQIAIGCLSNPFIGVLWQKVRKEKGLTYGIGAGLSMQDHYNCLRIVTSTQTETVKKTIETIRDVVIEVSKSGFSQELVDSVKKSFLGNYKRSFSSTGFIAQRLNNYQLDNRPVDFHNVLIEKISALTAEDVNSAFKRFIKPDQFVIFTVGK